MRIPPTTPATEKRPPAPAEKSNWLGLLLAGNAWRRLVGLMFLTWVLDLCAGHRRRRCFAAFHYLVWGWWLSKFYTTRSDSKPRNRRNASGRFDLAGRRPAPGHTRLHGGTGTAMVILTPAEELGLSGLSLDSRVRQAIYACPPPPSSNCPRAMTAEAARAKLVYFRDGEVGRPSV